MTALIIRLFIKDYQNTEDPKVRISYGKTAGLTGIVTNLMLTAAKLIIGILFHSVSIIGDGINNLMDSASSIVTMVGFRLAGKPADKEHPYGHARLEHIAGLIVSILILMVGFELGRTSLDKAIHPEDVTFHWITVVVLGLSILLKLWQSLFYRKMGKTIRSATLKANSVDSLNDVIATSVVLAGSIVSYFIGFNLDGYLGMAVALFIMFSGVQLIRETMSPLLGQAPRGAVVEKVEGVFRDCPSLLGYHDLHIHDYGEGHYHATVHFEMDSTLTLEDAHEIVDDLERKAFEETGVDLVAHLDPVVVGDPRNDELRYKVKQILWSISEELSMHDFHVHWGEPTVISYDLAVPYKFYITDEELLKMVTRLTGSICDGADVRIVIDHKAGAEKEEPLKQKEGKGRNHESD